MARVELQSKEVTHLIQCGALDGLGDSRAALLAESVGMGQAGSALQLGLPFERPTVSTETSAQRLTWERFILGVPVSVTPLERVPPQSSEPVPLAHLPKLAGETVTVLGYRLPGWTGSGGYYVNYSVLKRRSFKLPASGV